MSAFPGPYNAIVYAQFNIQGRWRRMLAVAGGYTAVIGAGIWVTAAASGQPHNLEGWVAGLCGLQVFNLLVYGTFRVESAVRNDVNSRMLESHRLMPFPPLGSILGYIFGAPLQAILLALANFLLGVVCCAQSDLSLNLWAITNGILFCFAVFLYAMIVQFAFVARGGALLLLIAGITCIVMSGNEAMNFVPAVAVLLNPLFSPQCAFAQLLNSTRANHDITLGYFSALAGQAGISLIAIRVAIRRYLSSTVAGISARLGLMMLGIWVALSVMQARQPMSFSYSYRYRSSQHDDLVAETVVAFSTSLLLALLPIGSAAWTARHAQRSGDPQATKPKISTEMFTALAAAAIVAGLLAGAPFHYPGMNTTQDWTTARRSEMFIASGWTMVIVVNFLVSMAYLFSWGYLIRRRAWIFVCIWVLITWVAPVAVDGVYRSVISDNGDATILTAFSPPGALALIWDNSSVEVAPGIVGQIALSMVPTGILLFTQSRRRAKQVAGAQSP